MMERFIVGLMSGTSVDGIDAALTRIIGSGLTTKVEVLAFETYAFPSQIKRKILKALHPDTSCVRLICSLNFELGYCFADAVKQICQKAEFDLERLDAIGSHGQTIYHQPIAEADVVPSTLQIGEPAVIAFETKTQVVSNFRVMDMAAGGQGAPLVPYVDYLLFRKAHQAIALQNIGGIGNVTVIPQQAALEDVYAFDTGPGNMIIDALVHHFYGDAFDPNGKYARAGSVNERLLEELMSDPFIREKPPKTTGRERFGKDFVKAWLANWSHIPANDFITTATMFTAQAIAYNYKTFILPNDPIDEMIASGGGSHNQALMGWLKKLLPDIKIKTAEDCGLSSDAKEAVAFAVLANEMLNRQPANVPRATGASCPVVLGNLTPYMK
ncbi:anhydro-N-acetylmuramic acid kinase AnmK [Tuberibacillus calidus]|uniref:anhydro-N-acetylmuramic acid kinase AnmK n=1 Tax=Tuberibacillus calidus TaxID=340097 RepID=UPI0004007AA0|nr:anhydro-N-acetylmuramic acid kinase AnmK [Tuberibacillus calidus]